jgi:hypothetical protein
MLFLSFFCRAFLEKSYHKRAFPSSVFRKFSAFFPAGVPAGFSPSWGKTVGRAKNSSLLLYIRPRDGRREPQDMGAREKRAARVRAFPEKSRFSPGSGENSVDFVGKTGPKIFRKKLEKI